VRVPARRFLLAGVSPYSHCCRSLSLIIVTIIINALLFIFFDWQ
jgi:hypothetical protein